MKKTMEILQGAFAFSLLDKNKNILYLVTSYLPLSHMYIKGYGYFFHSDLSCLEYIRKKIIGCVRDGMNLWESWYCHSLEPYSIYELDLESGFQNKIEYIPNFYCPAWYKDKENKDILSIVIASGGIDSGMTGYLLKIAKMNPLFLHFNYGRHSQECEQLSIEKLSKKLGIPLTIINLNSIFSKMNSSLIDKNIIIDTGTNIGMKSTSAWVPGRNAIFGTITLSIAEDLIFKENYNKIYIASGFSQLSEETSGYPDNSTRFINSMMEMAKFGFISSSKIEFISVLENITKTEEWFLGDKLGFPFECTVSCDYPILKDGDLYLCEECGSTKLSKWAAHRAGVKDPRKFYNSKLPSDKEMKNLSILQLNFEEIINRLNIFNKNLIIGYYNEQSTII
jgi:queuosine biosynthesis protein QueC